MLAGTSSLPLWRPAPRPAGFSSGYIPGRASPERAGPYELPETQWESSGPA